MSRYLIDTNVFLYARGGAHPYRDPCRALLRWAREEPTALEASVEAVQEYAHILLRRGIGRAAALTEVEELRSQCRLHPFHTDVLDITCGLLARYQQLGVRDAVHAATAIDAGVGRILSTDRVFDSLTEVTRIDPAADGTPWSQIP